MSATTANATATTLCGEVIKGAILPGRSLGLFASPTGILAR